MIKLELTESQPVKSTAIRPAEKKSVTSRKSKKYEFARGADGEIDRRTTDYKKKLIRAAKQKARRDGTRTVTDAHVREAGRELSKIPHRNLWHVLGHILAKIFVFGGGVITSMGIPRTSYSEPEYITIGAGFTIAALAIALETAIRYLKK